MSQVEQIPNLPKTISGKRATVVLLAVILATGGLFYWVTSAYSVYNAARRQTERDWRIVATELDSRYRELDKLIQAEAETARLDGELGTSWRTAREKFSSTTLSNHQIEAASRLEQLIDKMPESVQGAAKASDKLNESVRQYEQAAKSQREIANRSGSQLLKTMLNLPDPLDLELHHKS